MDTNKVVPNLESVSKRVYTYENETIICREIVSFSSSVDCKIKVGKVLFTLSVSEGTAKMLMEDLYYGQYTGA